MKSIRTKLIVFMCALLTASMAVMAFLSITLNTKTTRGVLEQTMLEAAVLSADAVHTKLELFMNAAQEAGMNYVVTDENTSPDQKQAVIDRFCASYSELTRGNIIGADGISIFTGIDYNDRDYFHRSMAGETWVSDPLIARTTGEVSIIVSAPLWKNGEYGTTVTGVIFFVPQETFLNDIVSQIKISDGAAAQVINSQGTVVAHQELAMVAEQYNAMEEAKSDPGLQALAGLEVRQAQGEMGFGTYQMDGVERFMAYAPIAGAQGWSIGVNAPMDDFMAYTYTGIRYTLAALVAALAVTILCAILFASGIARPIHQCADRLATLAKGDLTSRVPSTTARDETGRLLQDLDTCVTSLREMIADVSHTLAEIAAGNLSVTAGREYPGDFGPIHTSQITILASLNRLVRNIAHATDHVSASAGQVSHTSQQLAQNSSEQSASITDLSQSMALVAERAHHSTSLARQVADSGLEVKQAAHVGAEQMDEMMGAVQAINEAGQSIEKVIKIIDDIAFQTNILALNAAVEAARAGSYGKGFAVVADEVRRLAAKSAEAARNTAALISDTIAKAGEGYTISLETRKSLERIIEGIDTVTTSIVEISSSSETQSQEIGNVNTMLENQAYAIGQNSASSEETAASSEEMESQASLLRQMVDQFQLADVTGVPPVRAGLSLIKNEPEMDELSSM